jgi:uncharacterized protein YbjQ (UPF0145 family)
MLPQKQNPQQAQQQQPVIVVSNNYITGYRVAQTLGFTYGLTVRSRGAVPMFVAGIRSIFGGEIHEFTDMLNFARQTALNRLIEHARQLGANAVLSARFDSSEMGQGMSEILAYGTAVIVVPEDRPAAPVQLG